MRGFVFDDGGRAAAGFTGNAGDCVARAFAIATGLPYIEVYRDLAQRESENLNGDGRRTARNGISKQVCREWMAEHGWTWTPTMKIGQGTTVHLRADELPGGRIVAAVSKHVVAVIDGVIHDTDPDVDRDGTRCVYGYWTKEVTGD